MPAEVNLESCRGQAYEAIGTHYDAEGGTVVNISGWTIAFNLKRQLEKSTLALGPIACTIVDSAAGTYKFNLTASQLASLHAGLYYWDVWRTDSGSEAQLAFGTFNIPQPVRNVP